MCNNNSRHKKSQENSCINYFKNEFNKSINEKANIWHNLKSASIKTAKLLLKSNREREKRRGERMLNCGSYLQYGLNNDDFLKVAIYNNNEFEKLYKAGSTLFNLEYETTIKSLEDMSRLKEIKHKFKSAHFCKSKLCPVCQWKASLKKRAEMYKILPKIKEENKGLRFLFLSLTIKNCVMSELKATIKKLNDGLRLMLKDEKLRFIKGTIKSLEITQGKSEPGTAHPHLHLLVAVTSTYFKGCNYLKYEDWQALWRKYLNIDYDPQIDIQAITNDPKKDIIRELLKTSLYIEKEKLNLFDENLFLEYSRQIDNCRTYELTGIFKEYRKKERASKKENPTLIIDEETGELIDLDMLVNSIAVEYIDNQYKYEYKDGIINKFIKIAQNHIKLIESMERVKELGLIEEQKELEQEESNEMLNIIKEFIDIADKRKLIKELIDKVKNNVDKRYNLLKKCYNSRIKDYTSFEEVDFFRKEQERIQYFINQIVVKNSNLY